MVLKNPEVRSTITGNQICTEDPGALTQLHSDIS